MQHQDDGPSEGDSNWWQPIGNRHWACLACKGGFKYEKKAMKRHEQSAKHIEHVQHQLTLRAHSSLGATLNSSEEALHHLLLDMQSNPPPTFDNLSEFSEDSGSMDLDSIPSVDTAQIAGVLLDFINENLSEEEVMERSDDELQDSYRMDFNEYSASTSSYHDTASIGDKRPRQAEGLNEEWSPWSSRLACTIDILMHLPRSAFSERQLDILLWLLKVNGVESVPSVRGMKDLQKRLQICSGTRTLDYMGPLGHRYFVNSLHDIIAQEMANPRVRPYLHFYPEDRGKTVNEYYQASNWRENANVSCGKQIKLPPMISIKSQHFYLYEPCVLDSGNVCMPFEWFQRDGKFCASAWPLQPSPLGWIIEEFHKIEVPEDSFLLSFASWGSSELTANLPDPKNILGSRCEASSPLLTPWTRTDPAEGNRWRTRARGRHVLSFPIWLYCDDTSGNQSKKWNKHNSYLFTPAGLPQHLLHQEYNIHFLCTSNIAPPLEMLDGIVKQLEIAWESGLEVWDCVLQDYVLVIPFIVALLGDNPMQSELACHIGLRGRHFCRVCKVKGFEAADAVEPLPPERHDNISDGGRQSPSADHNLEGDASNDLEVRSGAQEGQSVNRRTKKGETLAEMLERVKRFVRIGEPRNKHETKAVLTSMFELARSPGNLTKIKSIKTDHGVKDNFLDHFLDKIASSYSKVRTTMLREDALSNVMQSLPENIYSPVWKIEGLDPHSDTPVEILHVILLGFVKYLWRDVVQNQAKKDSTEYITLIARLSSLDVSGLGISPLSGQTLVQYAGSLTGRDFRAIAQVAPFVLYDLVPKPCYEVWIALSDLIPLVWQPVIPDIDQHLAQLENAVRTFIAATARWTPRWFNKPKFHILLHIVEGIRRFGPAILFATEGFESFNAVIRNKSIHSNRQAPSRDIAYAFAHSDRIRHILSGGRPLYHRSIEADRRESVIERGAPKVGVGPLTLVANRNIVTDYLGLAERDSNQGRCTRSASALTFDKTTSGSMYPGHEIYLLQAFLPNHNPANAMTYNTCDSVILNNGDKCKLGNWVLVNNTQDGLALGKVIEILQFVGSPNERLLQPDVFLIQKSTNQGIVPPYKMPRILISDTYSFVAIHEILCMANIQHRCAENGCTASGSTQIRQERQLTALTKSTVVHQNATDLILNMGRMRDSVHYSALRQTRAVSDADMDNAVMEGSVRESDLRRGATQNSTTRGRGQVSARTAIGRSRTQGRGRAQPRGLT